MNSLWMGNCCSRQTLSYTFKHFSLYTQYFLQWSFLAHLLFISACCILIVWQTYLGKDSFFTGLPPWRYLKMSVLRKLSTSARYINFFCFFSPTHGKLFWWPITYFCITIICILRKIFFMETKFSIWTYALFSSNTL